MDEWTHTFIATGLIAASYYFGRWQGKMQGFTDALYNVAIALSASEIQLDLDEDDNLVVYVRDYDGNQRKVE